jgi:DNA ligase-1
LEGIIAKDLSAPYVAGARKFAWIKLKKSYRGSVSDTFDVVIVGFYYGKGKRTKFGFGGVLTAVYDPQEDSYKTLAKVGSGFSEEQMSQFQELLSKIVVGAKPSSVDSLLEPDEWVKPQFVIEVNADEITESPVHTCAKARQGPGSPGLALRFPRVVSLRSDKDPKDATTVQEVVRLFELQRISSQRYGVGPS